MRKQTFLVVAMLLGLGATPSLAYQVWMGTHLMESTVASNLDDWALTASLLDGVNINRAPDDTNPASNPEWQTILGQVNHVGTTMVEIARPEVSRNPNIVDDDLIPNLSQELDQKLQGARNFGYEIDHIMIYDERIDGTLFEWTQTEIQHLRDQLDAKGQQDIGLIWRSTNNAQRNRDFSALPIIDHALIEASANSLLNNTNNQITLLNWLWTNPATANKDIILQIPRSNNSMTQYASTRRVAVKLGQELGYENGMQSDRLVFLPVTYNDNYDYLPETTTNGTSYTDSLTSLALSLIEQRPLFEGISGTPTNADADSFVRELPEVLISGAPDGSLRYQKNTGVVSGEGLGFVINSEELNVGQSGTVPYDRAAVMVFQLPDLGTIEDPFQTASFQGFLTETVTSGGIGGDLYGIDRRNTPDVLNSDYYGRTDTPDLNAVLLQDDFLVEDMAIDATVLTSAVGSANLIDFLNEQYAGGEGIGDYVFLRVSVDADTSQRWSLASGDATNDAQKPRLLYRALEGQFLDGDYNRDGIVNLVDYTVWRDNLGAAEGTLPNDPNNGAIGEAQYNTWRDNFGQALAFATEVETAAVPEPATRFLLAYLCATVVIVGRSGREACKTRAFAKR